MGVDGLGVSWLSLVIAVGGLGLSWSCVLRLWDVLTCLYLVLNPAMLVFNIRLINQLLGTRCAFYINILK